MAGGKETPRQKMIGMMYLVLTALLALNVSSTVIDKFLFIEDSLTQANKSNEERNAQTLKGISTKAKENNSEEDIKFLSLAQELRNRVSEISTYLADLKTEFINETGGFEEGHEDQLAFLVGKTDYDKVGHYMNPIEEGGAGNGEKLETTLDDYVDFVKSIVKRAEGTEKDLVFYTRIAEDASESEIYKYDNNQKGKEFLQLAFESSPTPAALATISEFQSKVLQYETVALDFLSKKVGGTKVEFDKIVPVVLPLSQYVAAGAKYEAEMFIAASTNSTVVPVMTKDGVPLSVSDGKGKVSFTASAGSKGYGPDGIAKRSFKASISLKDRSGRDQVFEQDIDYYVVKPVMQIKSDAVQQLYLNCGNDLDVQVPALGIAYNPTFSAKGGKAIKGSQTGKVRLVPKSGKLTMTVSNGGNIVGSETFIVRRIPSPTIAPYIGNRPVNLKTGMPVRTPRINLKALADEDFAKFLPKDANFRVTEAVVSLVRSGSEVNRVVCKSPNANISSLTAQARKGDYLAIEIKKVVRSNYNKEIEAFNNIPTTSKFFTIPLR